VAKEGCDAVHDRPDDHRRSVHRIGHEDVFAELFLFGYDSVTGIGVALKTRGCRATDTPAVSIACSHW
jgi:hypothetical protein